MGVKAFSRADVGGRRSGPGSSTQALSVGDLAWLALVPSALLSVIVVLLFGPLLGRMLLAPDETNRFWRHFVVEGIVRPEPTEHARYALALLGPALVVGWVAALSRWHLVKRRSTFALLLLAQGVLVGWVAGAIAFQQRFTYDASYVGEEFRTVYFTPATLVVALAIAALIAALLRLRALPKALQRADRERWRTRLTGVALALGFVVVWLLSAFNTDASLPGVNGSVWANIGFWSDESFAILNGHAPLVDFHAQYGQLWAYVGAAALALIGTSFAAYAALMLTGTAAALLLVYATLRRLAASTPLAATLFLPFVATSFFMEAGPSANRYGPANLFSVFPIRYAGPFLLLWLVVRRIERRSPRSSVPLFAVAGLVAVNNLEF
ncbi:MAG TPA: hypothetical protein VFS37_03000, partial [Conexibacter sp.]|nr:hypothetical protein [Conexibacter sp.]